MKWQQKQHRGRRALFRLEMDRQVVAYRLLPKKDTKSRIMFFLTPQTPTFPPKRSDSIPASGLLRIYNEINDALSSRGGGSG